MSPRIARVAPLVVLGLLAGCISVAAGSAAAHQGGSHHPAKIADWTLDEAADATQMRDAGPNHLRGRIGDAVETAFTFDGATGYHWDYTKPNEAPPKPERLVVVKETDKLDPMRGYFSVSVRYRTTHSFGNLIQKGQAGAAGGYWKMQLPKGIAQCFFRGPNGSLGATSPDRLDDGDWHTVRCEREAQGITMTVDGEVVREKEGSTGPIDNDRPLTIGGKKACDQVHVTCDYFTGEIDRIRIFR